MGRDGTPYEDPGADFFTRLHPERAKSRALHQLESMGYQVTNATLTRGGIFASEL
jgi:transposase